MLKGLFGLKRLLVELRRIANALEVIALHYAAIDGRMWSPSRKVILGNSEEAELLHTTDEDMLVNQLRGPGEFEGKGWTE